MRYVETVSYARFKLLYAFYAKEATRCALFVSFFGVINVGFQGPTIHCSALPRNKTTVPTPWTSKHRPDCASIPVSNFYAHC